MQSDKISSLKNHKLLKIRKEPWRLASLILPLKTGFKFRLYHLLTVSPQIYFLIYKIGTSLICIPLLYRSGLRMKWYHYCALINDSIGITVIVNNRRYIIFLLHFGFILNIVGSL